jgi:glycosyltransferase involved in cell wall biosynthesis
VLLIGRRDEPTDGVEDYCAWLGRALRQRGIHVEVVRAPWSERGWIAALLWLGRKSQLWRNRYVLVQYTALGWSRRGFPVGLLPLLFLLRRRHISFGVVLHDTSAYPGTRLVDRIRRATQRFVMKKMTLQADRVIMPANSQNLTWLTLERSKVAFMPVGSNIPAPPDPINSVTRLEANDRDRPRTIVVFGITDGGERREKEIAVIRELMVAVRTQIPGVRFCAFGRGAKEAEPELRRALNETGIEPSVFGLLPAEEIGEMLSQADVQIDVRAPISSRRGSVVAGIVCQTPVVGFETSETDPTIREAGVVLVPSGNIRALTAAVTRILSDDSFREELRLRNRAASCKYFSWDAISDQMLRALRPAVAVDGTDDRKYRILLVCSHPVQYASPVFRQMALDPRLDILVAYCSLQGAEASVDEEFGHEVEWDVPLLDGYPWIRVHNRAPRPGVGRFFGLINPRLWGTVRRGNYDAILLFTGYNYFSFWIAVLAAKLSHTAVLFGTDATSIQARIPAWWKPLIKRFVLSRIYRLADGKWAASEAGQEYLKSLEVPEEHIGIVPLVVDNDWWTARAKEVNRSAVRRSWGVPETAPVVLFCAKLQPWKRPSDLLRAFARSGVPEARLVFAGTGPLARTLASEAEQLGIANRVHFIGFQNQTHLPAVYCSADLFVLPSEYDACPAVVCEAMLCGLPVILSDEIRGRFELIDPGRTGFIFRCGDIAGLARLLWEALADRARLRVMGTAAQQSMQNCSPRTNVRDSVRLLDQVFRTRTIVGR